MYRLILVLLFSLAFIFSNCDQKQRDTTYQFVEIQIASTIWMAENLSLPVNESYCYLDSNSNCIKYGRLYTWNAAMKACPKGWKLPSDQDWFDLTNDIGGSLFGAEALKELGKSGFNALYGGKRLKNGTYIGIGKSAIFWSSSEVDEKYAWNRIIDVASNEVQGNPANKSDAYCVRCIKIRKAVN